MIRFEIEAKPVPFTRTSRAGRCRDCRSTNVSVRSWTDERYAAYREQIGWAAKAAGAKPVEGPIIATISLAADRAHVQLTSYPSTLFDRPRGDLDNYTKAILDGLNGVAYVDDRQVVRLTAAFETR
jgi:crossover junction endodeoxyribonuclease RusA